MTGNDGRDRREYAPSARLAVIAVGLSFFLVALPWLIAVYGRQLERNLTLPPIAYGRLSLLLGTLLILVGLFFALWSVSRLFSLGRGTPLPVMPPPELVVRPPYSYCRNPMAFGVILAYLGFGLAIRSLGALVLVALFASGILVYIKATEERGLKRRFGERYIEYKRRTPFLFPRIR